MSSADGALQSISLYCLIEVNRLIIFMLFLFIYRHSWIFLPTGRTGQSPGPLDWSRQRQEEKKAILQVPDFGAGKRVSVQRLRLKAEEVGAGQKSEPNRAPDKNLVPKQAHEKQEEQPKTTERQP